MNVLDFGAVHLGAVAIWGLSPTFGQSRLSSLPHFCTFSPKFSMIFRRIRQFLVIFGKVQLLEQSLLMRVATILCFREILIENYAVDSCCPKQHR